MKIDVIPNSIEKCMAFVYSNNLVFIDSMQFMNCSLEKLVNNLTDADFKCLTQELGSKNLGLLKQIGRWVDMSRWTVLKDLMKKNCLIKNVFTAL